MGTAPPTITAPTTGTSVAVVGTEDVHAAQTATTSTIAQPGVTATVSSATPTDTSVTIKTTTGTAVGKTTKKKP